MVSGDSSACGERSDHFSPPSHGGKKEIILLVVSRRFPSVRERQRGFPTWAWPKFKRGDGDRQ